ncbi:hypothetical protein RJ639_032487 [Escallonia herrerae]|uniref:N-acetyltransferase domain-containing protein n=1 Tax=Escallonia herrerae TaxID=1293975 RepID=A0AA89BBL1_9ASTE|nr:hypothetical protein RJ639_032487 [Escallonia herrerae]
MHCCFLTHISLLLASSIGQLLAILSLFTKEKSSLSMLKSPRDPREAKLLLRLECGVLMAMFVMQLGVLALTCAVHSCWVREYEGIEAEREKTARRRSRRIVRVQEESMANVAKISDSKAKELDEKMKTKYGQWVAEFKATNTQASIFDRKKSSELSHWDKLYSVAKAKKQKLNPRHGDTGPGTPEQVAESITRPSTSRCSVPSNHTAAAWRVVMDVNKGKKNNAMMICHWMLSGKQNLGVEAPMSTFAIHRPDFLRTSCNGARNHHNFGRTPPSSTILNYVHVIDKDIQINRIRNVKCSQTRKKEELSLETREKSVSQFEEATPTNLKFDRLQLQDQDYVQENKVEFGDFVAREAVLDEEYWTAAWLRAETHWENRNDRYVDNYKRKFAEQEFNAIKRQCKGQFGQKCSCIVAVKKEESNVKHTVLKSVVGTLDFNIRHLLTGETFPGERVKAPIFCRTDRQAPRKYGYVANLCVAKSARRQGIASNMLNLAILSAKSNGAEQVFVHVLRSNLVAQELYEKMGFEVVEMASPQLSKEKTYLLCFRV